jgi:hypothetical protein
MTTIKITMSERRPLSIDPKLWPVIAQADWHNGQHDFQANTIRRIKVRQHADGRRIVYGIQAGIGRQPIGTRNPEAGFLLAAGADEDETIRALRRVGGVIGDGALAEQCIGDLPAEEIDRKTASPRLAPQAGVHLGEASGSGPSPASSGSPRIA